VYLRAVVKGETYTAVRKGAKNENETSAINKGNEKISKGGNKKK